MKPILALAVLALSAAAPAFAASDFYLSSSSLGTCAAKNSPAGYLPISDYAISGTDPGAGAKIMLGDFVISKRFDDCSGVLATQFLEEQAFPTLTLTGQSVASTGSTPVTFLVITLTNAVIDSYRVSHGDESVEEAINFRYQSVCIMSTPVDGSKGTNVCYDSSTNRVTTSHLGTY